MTRDDIQKLLGGYATGTLTPEEQQALFAAALDDQELFDALAKEQALRDLLRDPAARAHVLAAIDQRPDPWWRRASRWMLRPAAVGAMAGCLAAVVGYGIWHARQPGSRAPVLVAGNRPEKVAPVLAAPPAEPPAPVRRSAAPPAKRAAPAASAAPPATATGSLNQPLRDQGQPAPAAPMQQAPIQQQIQASQQTGVSAQSESITVTAAAPGVQAPVPAVPAPAAPSGMALSLLQGDKAESPVDALSVYGATLTPVRWSALRREADGRLSPVESNQIHAGDAIVLRLTAMTDGQLSVSERMPDSAAPRTVMPNTRVERAKPLDTPPVTLDHPGDQELLVRFTALPPVSAVSSGSAGFAGARMAKRQEPAAKDSTSAAPPVQTITLHYR